MLLSFILKLRARGNVDFKPAESDNSGLLVMISFFKEQSEKFLWFNPQTQSEVSEL